MRYGILATLAVFSAACSSDNVSDCAEEAAMQCDGDVLQECVDGVWEDDTDCAAQEQMCHDEGVAHCMDAGDTMGSMTDM